jgi:hypothetical protein
MRSSAGGSRRDGRSRRCRGRSDVAFAEPYTKRRMPPRRMFHELRKAEEHGGESQRRNAHGGSSWTIAPAAEGDCGPSRRRPRRASDCVNASSIVSSHWMHCSGFTSIPPLASPMKWPPGHQIARLHLTPCAILAREGLHISHHPHPGIVGRDVVDIEEAPRLCLGNSVGEIVLGKVCEESPSA